jgi:lipopolysaccharide transport system ATP-binding protein
MSEIAIHVENLGKLYRIGERQRYKALRDTLSYTLYAPFRAAASLFNGHQPTASSRSSNNHFWALQDVSFEVKKGEVVGIIGRNGAGKSTLLKILSRITKPTEGYVRIHGRVGSLLEVGTGFHPELTGRENIYLNGAIIGMRKKEIDRKFDEIVAFAEVEKFIDTPVKLYSSGMYVRLAFAVAAHLEPEILLVDEVLAVGDIAFQKKCLGKMGDVATEGRTVLFVSHSMAAVQRLCTRAIALHGGQIAYRGEIGEVVRQYLNSIQNGKSISRRDEILEDFNIVNDHGEHTLAFRVGEAITFIARLAVPRFLSQPTFGYGILNYYGERITTLHTAFQYAELWPIEPEVVVSVHWKRCNLCPGTYTLMAALYDGTEKIRVWDELVTLVIEPSDYFATGKLPETGAQGWFLSDAEWHIVPAVSELN